MGERHVQVPLGGGLSKTGDPKNEETFPIILHFLRLLQIKHHTFPPQSWSYTPELAIKLLEKGSTTFFFSAQKARAYPQAGFCEASIRGFSRARIEPCRGRRSLRIA